MARRSGACPVIVQTRVTKGPGSRAAGLAMAFKLIESAQQRWRAVNAPHLVALVRAGATFRNGHLVERTADAAGQDPVRPARRRLHRREPDVARAARCSALSAGSPEANGPQHRPVPTPGRCDYFAVDQHLEWRTGKP